MSYAMEIERYTYEDYKLWKGDWEMIDGLPVAMSPSPMRDHQSIATSMIFILAEQVEECEECQVVNELDYIIDDENVLRPDIAVICNEEHDFIIKPPKVVVEVLSPSTAKRDEKTKLYIYESQKIPYYIIVDPKTLVAKIYKLDGKEYDFQGVFTNEKYSLKVEECEIEIDFQRVFKKFKK